MITTQTTSQQPMNPVIGSNLAKALLQPKPMVINVANREPAKRGVPKIFMYNDELLFTVPQVMDKLNIKSRITLDRHIEEGHISPVKRKGRQPATNQGRRMLFRQKAIDTLAKYMSKHGRINPFSATEPKPKKAATTYTKTVKVVQNDQKDVLMAQLDEAISKVERLEAVVKALSANIHNLK